MINVKKSTSITPKTSDKKDTIKLPTRFLSFRHDASQHKWVLCKTKKTLQNLGSISTLSNDQPSQR